MSTTNTLTGPTVGITGVPQEFLCTLSAASVGADVITLSSANGLDRFSASPGGSTTSTVTIPSGSSQVWFYLVPAAGAARNISIVDGNGYTVSGSPISFLPSATLGDPTTWSWVAGGTYRPALLLDPGKILFNMTNMSGLSLAGVWSFGNTAPTITLNASGMTIVSTSTSCFGVIALPLSCYPALPLATIELTIGSQNAQGGYLEYGPSIIRTDSSYPGSNGVMYCANNGSLFASYQVTNSGVVVATVNSGSFANYSLYSTPGTAITGVFGHNVMSLFYRPPAGTDTFAQGMSSSFITAAQNGSEITTIIPGTCDQRDTVIAPNLTLGIAFYANVVGASLNISQIRTGYYGGGSTIQHIPVRRTSTGAPVTDSNGNILITSNRTVPCIDNNHTSAISFANTHWYYPATDTLSAPLTTIGTIRIAPYTTTNPSGATRLVTDVDATVLLEDRPGNPNYGNWHIFQDSGGTNWNWKGADSTYNTSPHTYNLYSGDLRHNQAIILTNPQAVSLPATCLAAYETKFLVINNTWYAVGVTAETAYQVAPIYLFIASGSSPTAITTAVYGPAAPGGITSWDGCGVERCQGVWYATPVESTTPSTECWNLLTATEIGTLPFTMTLPFVPHTNLVAYQFTGANGKPYTQFRRLSHDDNFTQWGYDWSAGGTNRFTFQLGNMVTNRSPIFPGWEWPAGTNFYRALENGSARMLESTWQRLLEENPASMSTGTVMMMMVVNLACG